MSLKLRIATVEDVPAIRALLADDDLGRTREDLSEAGLARYLQTFAAIEADPRNHLFVAENEGRIVGTWQVTYIPYLSRGGNERAHIEAVRVASNRRGEGIGRAMMRHALDAAKARGCLLAQLTSDKTRPDAHRFYESLGFTASHSGFKMVL